MRTKILQFLKEYGVRTVSNLQHPRLFSQKKLFLPFESIYHFQADNSAVRGPNSADPLFTRLTGKTFIEHVIELTSYEGNPRVTNQRGPILINNFRKQNRFFKPLLRDEAVRLNQQNTLVLNYNLLPAMWRYQDTYKATWFRWNNERRTFWANVVAAHRRFDYNQFIELEVPERILKFSQFNMLNNGTMTQDLLAEFSNDALLNVFDIFQWLGNKRDKSLMDQLPPESYAKINFLIRVRDSFFVLNVGNLDLWRSDKEAGDIAVSMPDGTARDLTANPLTKEEREEIALGKKGLDGSQIQRRFLSLIAALVEYSQGNVTITDVDEEVKASTVNPEFMDQRNLDTTGDKDVTDEEIPEPEATPVEADPRFVELDLIDLDMMVAKVAPPDADLFSTELVIEGTQETKIQRDAESGDVVRTLRVREEPDIIRDAPPELKTVVTDAYDMYKAGLISEGTVNKAVEDAMSYHHLPNPFHGEGSIQETMKIHEEDLKIPPTHEYAFRDQSVILDKSMLTSKLKAMQQKYVKDVLPKDIMQAVIAAQAAGAAVVGYSIETVEDLSDHYQIHKVILKPVRGKASPVFFKIPVIDEEGRFRSRGVTYRQRLQRGDIPIRKVESTKVALTSYYNKTFVFRSPLAVNNYDEWLHARIRAKALNPEDNSVTNVMYAELVQNEFKLPRAYSMMGKAFQGFTTGEIDLYFRYSDREKWFLNKYNIDIAKYETNGMIVCGAMHGTPVVMDTNSQMYLVDAADLEPIGTVTDLVGVDTLVAPLEAALINVSNKDVPLGFVLAFHGGLSKLLNTLNVTYTRHPRSERVSLASDEYAITFQDERLVFNRGDYKAMLLMAGFHQYKNSLLQFSIHDFDQKDVYYRLFEDKGMNARYIRKIEGLFKSWVDPITRDLLRDMGEPTEFEPLLYRSAELLMTDWSPAEVDGAFMRYRGYERMAGTIYSELTKAIETFRARNTEVQVMMDPHEVWRRIAQDPSVGTIEDANPIAQIREQEAITYRGDGGRGGQSMVARTRVFTKADLGILSESTVDSGDVGVVAYLAPDANFENMRYIGRPFDPETEAQSKVMSTCAQLGVATSNDDSKRVAFVSIQQQQGISSDGNTVTPLRTGGEVFVGQRVGKIFCGTAQQDGKVKTITEDGVIVVYADGTEEGFPLGTHHGSAAGKYIPHTLVCDLVEGATFIKGDTISYNSKYFVRDRLVKGQVLYKGATMVAVTFSDNLDTLEDGSSISEEVARQLNTQTTKVKDIVVRFDQALHEMVNVGDKVDLETILCIIEDPEVSGSSLFDESAKDMLRRMAAFSPTSGVVGSISKIETFYHGNIEDMTPSLAKVAMASDKQRKASADAIGKKAYTGAVTEDFRTGGDSLQPEMMVIRVYIDHNVPCATGDKGVLCNQMKTVFSRVLVGENTFEDGRPIGLIFGNTSVENRMVLSPKIIASYSILQLIAGKQVAGVYRGTKNAKAK